MLVGGVRDGGAAPVVADEWNPWENEQVDYNSALNKRREAFKQYLNKNKIDKNKPKRYKVQIWGKAAIGMYDIYAVVMSCNKRCFNYIIGITIIYSFIYTY